MSTPLCAQSFMRSLNDPGIERRMMQHLFWPCSLYSIAVKKEQNRVNIFEKAVLRLMGLGVESHERIAEYLCLDIDLVRFLFLRLQQKGLAGKDGLTSDGKDFLVTKAAGMDTTAFMYQECIEGKLLPFASERTPQFLLSAGEKSYYLGDIGSNYKVRPRIIFPNKTRFPAPSPQDVSKNIEDFLRLHRNTPPLYDRDAELPSFMLNTASMRVQPKPQLVYLHCICTLSPDGSRIFVRNPFAYDDELPVLSEIFARCPEYDTIKQEFLDRVSSRKHVSAVPEMISSDIRYPEIAREFGRAERAFGSLDKQDSSGEETKGKRRKLLIALHACMEYLLRRMTTEREDDGFAALLGNGDAVQNGKILYQAAERLNLECSREESFLRVSSDEIRACRNGRMALRPLFALALAAAASEDRHPLRRLAEEMPDMINRLIRLKSLRDMASHGDVQGDKTSNAELAGLRELVFSLLQAFCPELTADASGQDTHKADSVDMPAVEKALLPFFPQRIRNRFPKELEQELRLAEGTLQQYGIGCELAGAEIPARAIMFLYSFCQQVFGMKGSGAAEIGEASAEAACTRARQAGFLPPDGQLPQELARTTPENLRKALQGDKTTLGGVCLAYLLRAATEELERTATLRPTLLTDVAGLIRLRGHGQGLIPASEAEMVRKAIYEDCCVLLGE